MNDVVLFGCGGHSRSVADVILYNNPSEKLIFVDSDAKVSEKIFGFEVLPEIHINADTKCFITIGENISRKYKYEELSGANIITVISKLAYVGRDVTIGRGTIIAHSCHLGPGAVIGENTIINTGSVIEHEVKIGSHTHVGPNATISGRSVIGDSVFIGVGACVIDNISICDNVIIGANTTVFRSIVEPGTYVGSPLRKVK
jgi:UDP-N-acetylbacillosamine N-acetyltransferase